MKKVLIVACSCIGALVIFQAGLLVGYSKAVYSNRLGENYFKSFDGREAQREDAVGLRKIFVMGMEVPGGHGAVGKIVQINFPTFIVASNDGIEKVVRVNDQTLVRHTKTENGTTSLAVDDIVVVLGSPNDAGEVEAKLIRIMPAPPAGTAEFNPR